MGVTWAEASVALVLMCLRTYTNAFINKSFKWDYFWAVVTLVRLPFTDTAPRQVYGVANRPRSLEC